MTLVNAPRLQLEVRAQPMDRRLERRELVRQPVTLQLLPLQTDALKVRAYIMDVSKRGVGLQSPLNLPRGTTVQIRLTPTTILTGDVRYTVPWGDGYYSGVLVEGITDPDSRDGF